MNKIIITINRECGTGGREIAYLIGEKLGLKVYDRSMLEGIAKQFDMTIENIEKVKAQKTNWWSDFCRFYQQFGAASHTTPTKHSAERLLCRSPCFKRTCGTGELHHHWSCRIPRIP